jgi:hypothetical protein
MVPCFEANDMNKKRKAFRELDCTVALLVRLVESEGTGLVHDKRVRLAIAELKKSRKGGGIDDDRLIRALKLITEAASDRLVK